MSCVAAGTPGRDRVRLRSWNTLIGPTAPLIETVPGKRGGKPVIKGTRLRPEDLLTNREQGIEWLVENHGGITPDTVRAVFNFYDTHKKAIVSHLA
jgi:uncharacterized protein (DUF433 family)